jgi:hypothetical protein
LGFAAGSKFPFMQNMPPQQQQQSQNNWPMHMGFNQNSNEGGFNNINQQVSWMGSCSIEELLVGSRKGLWASLDASGVAKIEGGLKEYKEYKERPRDSREFSGILNIS